MQARGHLLLALLVCAASIAGDLAVARGAETDEMQSASQSDDPQTRTEPPIRVKNGSVVLELDAGTWKKHQGGRSPSNRPNRTGRFAVVVLDSANATCPDGRSVSGATKVEIHGRDGETLQFKAVGRPLEMRTVVTPRSGGKAQGRRLEYQKFAYVHRITADVNGWSCTFEQEQTQDEIATICPGNTPGC